LFSSIMSYSALIVLHLGFCVLEKLLVCNISEIFFKAEAAQLFSSKFILHIRSHKDSIG
jgi:hypothetical protein